MSGQVVKNHTLLKTAKKCKATRKTTPALPVRLRVHLQHRFCITQQQKTLRRVQQQHEVTVQAVDCGETSCTTPNKRNKNKEIDLIVGSLLHDLAEWLEDFTENLVEEGVSASSDTPASTSRESDQELSRKVVSGNHSIFIPERPNFQSVQEDPNYKGFLQKTHWQPSTSSRKLGDLITTDHKVLRE